MNVLLCISLARSFPAWFLFHSFAIPIGPKHVHALPKLVARYAGGELWTHIDASYSEAVAAQIVRSIVQTLAQFHAHSIVWRDCKVSAIAVRILQLRWLMLWHDVVRASNIRVC